MQWHGLTLAVVGAWPLIGPPPGGFTAQTQRLVGWSNYTQWSQLGAFKTLRDCERLRPERWTNTNAQLERREQGAALATDLGRLGAELCIASDDPRLAVDWWAAINPWGDSALDPKWADDFSRNAKPIPRPANTLDLPAVAPPHS